MNAAGQPAPDLAGTATPDTICSPIAVRFPSCGRSPPCRATDRRVCDGIGRRDIDGLWFGDSTVAKTPQATTPPVAASSASSPTTPSSAAALPPTSSAAPADPCAVNLASPAIVRVVSELPRDPRSQQPWNPEPLAGNYNECAQLSAVIVKANTNDTNPTTRAVMFHLGQFIKQGSPTPTGSPVWTSRSPRETRSR
ncbi:hypothetical protein NIIDMKKI_17070 [Mycobacterium kansasii]|uniref:Uncharacterized protein n=1 Tax=Mycobacterium kansasii TaxID=1768 RepID=A0A7G1I695_MYCKA|nr:hypothetical protein NIIDMKKI_17070 [Mycobacterium kansasii]